ncbi:kama family protein [Xylariaceae sp. FL1272]|nr:kama family protein [Xylariaceae sp. FL1272]
MCTQQSRATSDRDETIRPGCNQSSTSSLTAHPHREQPEFWRSLQPFSGVSRSEFLSWRWSTKNVVETSRKLFEFMSRVVPDQVPRRAEIGGMQTRDEVVADVAGGIRRSTMSIRIMPYVLSRMNWNDPANCPIFRQFIPLRSVMLQDHPEQTLDPLHEQADSPVDGVVHRYPDKALFLPNSVCPTYCNFCTRSYGKSSFKLSKSRLEKALDYIASQDSLQDIVVSGGDAYYLPPHILEWIGDRLIGMKNGSDIQRFRFASKGLAVAPSRFIEENETWTQSLIRVANKARKAGKHCALHTHFNHPNEISWITEQASRRLSQEGLTVRNQTVMLRGVNDDTDTMSSLMRKLAAMLIQPYYVYQCDMVPKVEHLRTPLKTILAIESELRGSIAGFYSKVDLPGGGGKRLACSYESYDRETGISTFRAPVLRDRGKGGKVYKYYDPLD